MMNKHVFNRIVEKIKLILIKNHVKRAALFGSFARGESTKKSDIDLLVEFKGKKSLFDLVGLKIELEETIGREFDVVTYKSLHPMLKDRILAEQLQIL